jgi:hypothetical protein
MATQIEQAAHLAGWVIEQPPTPECHEWQRVGPGSCGSAIEAGIDVRHVPHPTEGAARGVADALTAHYAEMTRRLGHRPYLTTLRVRYYDGSYTTGISGHAASTGMGNS